MSRSLSRHAPELGQITSQSIDDLGPLPHQEITLGVDFSGLSR